MRNLKRALSLGLTAAMISGLMVMGSSAASSSYTDVADTDNVEAIEVLKAVGIMVGDESGDFNPDQKVTPQRDGRCHVQPDGLQRGHLQEYQPLHRCAQLG